MLCQTVKTGLECAFMSKKGCGFFGGSCHVIIDKWSDAARFLSTNQENTARFILIQQASGSMENARQHRISSWKLKKQHKKSIRSKLPKEQAKSIIFNDGTYCNQVRFCCISLRTKKAGL